jgi:hypothetical protein
VRSIRCKVLTVNTIGCCLLLVGLNALALGQATKQRVSVQDAKQLVLAALPSKAKQLPKFGLEQYEYPASPGFYFFTAYWAGAPHGSMVIGNYAVDESTADIWNAVMACEELNTPALHRLQAKVRSRLSLSNAEYHKQKRTCPLEMGGR